MARRSNPLAGFREIGNAAVAFEERELTQILSNIADRVRNLPGARNTDTPRHRVRSLFFLIWSDSTSLREVRERIQENLNRFGDWR